jgi:hypothetical protein
MLVTRSSGCHIIVLYYTGSSIKLFNATSAKLNHSTSPSRILKHLSKRLLDCFQSICGERGPLTLRGVGRGSCAEHAHSPAWPWRLTQSAGFLSWNTSVMDWWLSCGLWLRCSPSPVYIELTLLSLHSCIVCTVQTPAPCTQREREEVCHIVPVGPARSCSTDCSILDSGRSVFLSTTPQWTRSVLVRVKKPFPCCRWHRYDQRSDLCQT